MKVMRCVEQDVANFNIGDIINFTLVDGEEVQAMAMKKLDNGILFCFVDCLTENLLMMMSGDMGDMFNGLFDFGDMDMELNEDEDADDSNEEVED